MHTRLAVLVDGFNLFHSIQDVVREGVTGNSAKWLDLNALANSFCGLVTEGVRREVVSIDYFSAFARYKECSDAGHVARHEDYVAALESVGVRCHMHRFKNRSKKCRFCKNKNPRYEEKETDVALAVQMVRIFVEKSADIVVVVSGDTDISPAVRAVYEMFPAASVWFAFPYNRQNNELEKLVKKRGGHFKLGEAAYRNFRFGPKVTLADGTTVDCPSHWA